MLLAGAPLVGLAADRPQQDPPAGTSAGGVFGFLGTALLAARPQAARAVLLTQEAAQIRPQWPVHAAAPMQSVLEQPPAFHLQ
ncbi:hypothetical protein SynROS8604_00411 [Synechococcus sp. ROS8604]|nr:hypothetical protein SynROS8604_00411 [Synechococcus sp. ROS8604]